MREAAGSVQRRVELCESNPGHGPDRDGDGRHVLDGRDCAIGVGDLRLPSGSAVKGRDLLSIAKEPTWHVQAGLVHALSGEWDEALALADRSARAGSWQAALVPAT